MADEKPRPSHLWKPGQSGNPAGPGRLPDDVKQLVKASRANVIRTIHEQLFSMSHEEVRAVRAATKSARTLEVAVASIIDKAITMGDQARLSMLLDRLIGKVKEADPEDGESTSAFGVVALSPDMAAQLLVIARGEKK